MRKKNKLINEQSPYLLQHAYNPVEWFPWVEEAFEKARSENKPIFLSIGYSTCHWCHVMEKESFEDEEVAKLMNEAFVSIKVDREERPDIDGIYMTVCQMLTGSGGWPLTIVMTPDKKPFFAGTYFPKYSRYGRVGMIELVPQLKEIWKTKHSEIINSAEEISRVLVNASKFSGDETLTVEIIDKGFEELKNRFDNQNGGFGKYPKFPAPHNLTFLLRYWKKSKNQSALNMVEKTLQNMRLGGIYDQVGFGFHRYSTDEKWLVPHFEKMLYDQALLAVAYTEAFQATKNDLYKITAQEILEYVNREMRSKKGGFFSAEDADSEGEEGKYYLWTFDEIKSILKDDAEIFLEMFNCTIDGNWFDPAHGSVVGTNILHLKNTIEEFAQKRELNNRELGIKISLAQKQLLAIREQRVNPHKDDKILTDWNSLMISAFAKAAQVFGEKMYAEMAAEAVKFLMKYLVDSNGKLLHRYRNGKSDIIGNLNDYAFFISALLDLYETNFEAEHLKTAINLSGKLIQHFWDNDEGGFYFTSDDNEKLLVRQKEIYDGAIPAGNSVALLNMIRLYRFTGNPEYYDKASRMIKTFSDVIKSSPSGYTQFLSALDCYFGPSMEVIIAESSDENGGKYVKILRENFIPNKVILYQKSGKNSIVEEISEFATSYAPVDGKTTVYICKDFKCNLPLTSAKDLKENLHHDELL